MTIYYTYQSPYSVSTTQALAHEHIYSYLDDQDRGDVLQINRVLLQWALKEDLIQFNDGQYLRNDPEYASTWQWYVLFSNFRGLVSMEEYGKLMDMLQSNNQAAVTSLVHLHTCLGTLFDEKILSTLCHRTLKSVSQIPHPNAERENIISWDRIHKETPFLWLLIYIQVLIDTTEDIKK